MWNQCHCVQGDPSADKWVPDSHNLVKSVSSVLWDLQRKIVFKNLRIFHACSIKNSALSLPLIDDICQFQRNFIKSLIQHIQKIKMTVQHQWLYYYQMLIRQSISSHISRCRDSAFLSYVLQIISKKHSRQ